MLFYSKKNFFSFYFIILVVFSIKSESLEFQTFDDHIKAENLISQGNCEEAEEILLSLENSSQYPSEYNDYNSLNYFFMVEALICQKKFNQALSYLQIMMDWNKKKISPEYNIINVLNYLNYALIKIEHKDFQEAFNATTYIGAGILKYNFYWEDQQPYKVKFENEVFLYHNFMIHKLLDVLHILKNSINHEKLFHIRDDPNFCYNQYRQDHPLVCNKKKSRGYLLSLIDNDLFLYSQIDPWNRVNNIFRIEELHSLNNSYGSIFSKKDINQFTNLNRLETIYFAKRKKGKSRDELKYLERQIFNIYKKINQKTSKINSGSLSLMMSIPPIALEDFVDEDEIIIYLKFTNKDGVYENKRKLYTFITSDTWGGKKHKKNSTWLYRGSSSSNNLLLEKITQFKENISSPHTKFNKELSNKIFNSIVNSDDIFLKKKISFIVDENLINLPFNALINNNGRFLHEDHQIVVYTSPRHYVLSKNKKKRDYDIDFIGFGSPKFNNQKSSLNQINLHTLRNVDYLSPNNFFEKVPNLPETKKEILEIANLFPNSKIFLNENANEINFLGLNNLKVKYLSIASHSILSGEINEINEPTILLSPINTDKEDNDGLLTSSSISKLNLNFDLAVLSACNTYAAEDKNSESLSGVTNAFLVAGVNSIIASMWSVDSETTKELMVEFYNNLSQNLSKSKSLQLAISNTKLKFDHPFYWAPFVLIGGEN